MFNEQGVHVVGPAPNTGGAGTFSSITDTGLTAGRVVIVGTGGLLEDDSGLTYNKATDTLTTTTVVAALAGNASTASAVAVGGITGLGSGVATALAVATLANGGFLKEGSAIGATTPAAGTFTDVAGATAHIAGQVTSGGIANSGGSVVSVVAGSAFVADRTSNPGAMLWRNNGVDFALVSAGSATGAEFYAYTTGTPTLTFSYDVDKVSFVKDRGIAFTNQTSAAAAQLGTITNAPAAGNPTFWLKVLIGGVSFAIPCWPG